MITALLPFSTISMLVPEGSSMQLHDTTAPLIRTLFPAEVYSHTKSYPI